MGGGDHFDDAVQILVQFGVGLDHQGVRRALEDLVYVRVIERILAPVLALGKPSRDLEIGHPPVLLALAESAGDRDRPVGFHARRPEIVGELDFCKRHGPYRVVVLHFG